MGKKMNSELSILIIEDNDGFRSLACQVFDGYDKTTAKNFKEGREKFMDMCPDITLLDIGLPDGDGLDLLEEILCYDPEAYVVMLTVSNISTDVDMAKKRGAAGYIIKPFSYNKVRDCINQYYMHREKLDNLTPEQRADHIMGKLVIDEKKVQEKVDKEKMEAEKKQYKHAFDNVVNEMTILFVDDYPTNREKARTLLHGLGCNVDIAKSGEDTLEILQKQTYDMIFLDSQMFPGIDGYSTAKSIRKMETKNKTPPAKIVAMVEYADEIENNLWQDSGMDSFIKKPTRFSALNEAISNYANNIIKITSEES